MQLEEGLRHLEQRREAEEVVKVPKPQAKQPPAEEEEEEEEVIELLSDEDKKACALFGVWKEKSMYGKKYMGIVRSAFLIDEKGKLEQAWYKISPKDTPTNLLAALG